MNKLVFLAGTFLLMSAASAEWSETDGVATFAGNGTSLTEHAATLPANWSGQLIVSGKLDLHLRVDEELASGDVTVFVEDGSTLTKTGAGTLTLIPASGVNRGAIRVDAGTVNFKANAGTPAMFGPLAVAAGATVNVSDSPAANRHGVALRFMEQVKINMNDYRKGFYFKWFQSFADMESAWTTNAWAQATPYLTETTLSVADCFANGEGFLPPGYRTAKKCPMIARGIVAFHKDAEVEAMGFGEIYENDCMIIDGDVVNGEYISSKNYKIIGRDCSGGLHSFAVGQCHDSTCAVTLRAISQSNPDGLFYPDVLWNGVCFNGVNVAAGATLAIADGSAVGFAFKEGSAIAGTVTGDADSYLSFLSGKGSVASASAQGFNGKLEIGRLAQVAFTGENPVCPANLEGAGAVYIPENTTLRVPFAMSAPTAFKGNGTILLAADSTEEIAFSINGKFPLFEGKIETEGDNWLFVPAYTDGGGTYGLDDGEALVFPNSGESLFSGEVYAKVELAPFSDDAAWAKTGVGADANYGGECPPVEENGAFILTDNEGQRKTLILTNQTVTFDAAWEVRFTFSAETMTYMDKYRLGRGFAFLLQPQGADFAPTGDSVYLAAPDAEGFFLSTDRQWTTTTPYTYRGFGWIRGYGTDFTNLVSESAMQEAGISLIDTPVEVTVAYDGVGFMTVALKQGAARLTMKQEVCCVNSAKRSLPHYITLNASTRRTGDDTTPCCRQAVSGFSGWVKRLKECDRLAQDGYSFEDENWTVVSNDAAAVNSELADAAWTVGTNKNARAYVFTQKTFKAGEPLVIRFDQDYLDVSSDYKYTGTTFTFAKRTESNPPVAKSVFNKRNDQYLGTPTNTFGFVINADGSGSHEGVGIIVDGSKPLDRETEAVESWLGANAKGKTVQTTITYDGNGVMTLDLVCADRSYSRTHDFGKVFAAGDELVFVIAASSYERTANGASRFVSKRFGNFTALKYEERTLEFNTPVRVEDNAAARVKVGTGVALASTIPSLSIPSITLGVGSSLAITSAEEGQASFMMRAAEIRFPASGDANVTSLPGVTEVGRLAFSGPAPGTFSMCGNFAAADGVLEVSIPKAWLKLERPLALVNVAGVAWSGGNAPAFLLVDENGEALKAELRNTGGSLGLIPAGMTVIMR